MKNAALKLPSERETLEQEALRIAGNVDVNEFSTKAELKRHITALMQDYPESQRKQLIDCRVRTVLYERFTVKLYGPGVLEREVFNREEWKRKYGIK